MDFTRRSQINLCKPISGQGSFVIMPNHVHVLIDFGTTEQAINTIVGNGKRFMPACIFEAWLRQRQNS